MIKSPILIIGCARSGTTLLYQVLSEVPEIWSIGFESKAIIERHHSPAAKGWESGELGVDDLTPGSRTFMLSAFEAQAAPGGFWRRVNGLRGRLRNMSIYSSLKRLGKSDTVGAGAAAAVPQAGLDLTRRLVRLYRSASAPPESMRLLEKTPENCLRLPFMQALFPDARVLFLARDGRANVLSLMEGWRQPHLFPGYKVPEPVQIPGQTRGRWAFTLIPGWRDLLSSPLEVVCASQWQVCNETVLEYARERQVIPLLAVRYEDLIADPTAQLERIAAFLGIDVEGIPAYRRGLPEVNIISRPGAEKWRRDESGVIERITPLIAPIMRRLGYRIDT